MDTAETIRVLIIEDDNEDYLIARTLLSEIAGKQFAINRVDSYDGALPLIAENVHDVYLVDHHLGPKTGLELLQEAAKRGFRRPFILLTGERQRALDLAAMEAGASDYLVKGTLTADLLERSIRYARNHFEALQSLRDAHDELEVRVEERTAEIIKASTELTELNTRTSQILESITDAFFALNHSWSFTYLNPQAEEILGKSKESLLGNSIWQVFPELVGSVLYRKSHDAFETVQTEEFEEFYAQANRWFAVRLYPSPDGLSVFLADITERKHFEETIHHQSLYDSLTALPNRTLFEGRLTQALLNAHKNDSKVAVLFLDLDRFKTINDTLGHAKGDRLITQIADRLKFFERGENMVARFGADEFLIMLSEIEDKEEVVRAAKKVAELLRRPVALDDREVHINTSIGISIYPENGESVEVLIKNADAALYRAKEVGRNTYRLYTETLQSRAAQDLLLENELRQALAREEFAIHYQPIINIKSGQVVRSEALMRWNHPYLGVVFPGEFIPAAEETGCIVELGEWALRGVCSQIATWYKKGLSAASVAINISPRQFTQPEFCTLVKNALKEFKLPRNLLQIEITESMAMYDVEHTMQKLSQLKEMGVEVSIDDFGTGHSSLSYLKMLPIDRLKIDKSFTKNCTRDPRDAAIVQAIVSMGHTLGLHVCAEGIEHRDQFSFLKKLGCESAQGFYFSKSLPALEFEEWVKGFEKKLLPKKVKRAR